MTEPEAANTTRPKRRWSTVLGFHFALIALACAFLFPFIWMLLVAAKTDEEVAANSLPTLPAFRAVSPNTTANGVTGSLELLGVEVRTHDLGIHKIFSANDSGTLIESSDARLTLAQSPGGRRIEYDFSGSMQPVELHITFDLPVKFADLHKLAVAIKPDDSWHRLDASLEVEGQRWSSTRSIYLGQMRPTTIIYQPPSADDQSLKAKTWIPLERDNEAGDERTGRAVLTLKITPSGTPRAIFGKLTRNFDRVFRFVPFWKYVVNSVFVAVLSVAGMLFSSTFVAYAFARLNWPGRSAAMGVLLSTMMLPPQVTLVPSFVIVKSLGWYNTLNPMWVPSFLGSAFFIFLMVQHLRTIPRELEEAARIDGLGQVQTWYYIMLPQVKPAAAAIAILTFQAAWNDFLSPLLYLRDQSLYTLSLGLYDLQIYSANDQSVIMAGNVLMTLPVIVIFFLFQRYFVAGVTMTGMKG